MKNLMMRNLKSVYVESSRSFIQGSCMITAKSEQILITEITKFDVDFCKKKGQNASFSIFQKQTLNIYQD